MLPPLSLNASSTASSSGGNLDTKTNALVEGDWSTTYAPDSSAGAFGMNKKTMMYLGIAAIAYFVIKSKKAA